MSRFEKKDPLRKCIKWALMDRVNSTVDYVGNIWFNKDFHKKFKETASVLDGSRFSGKMLQLTAAYDKTCYYLIIAHVFFDLNVNFVKFTVGDALDFIAYCGFCCNGTVLIAEIHWRIMSDTAKYDRIHSQCGSMYQFLIRVNEEITSCSPGSCTQNRFNFSQGNSNTAWNTKREELLGLCKRFFKSDEIVRRQQSIHKIAKDVVDTLIKTNGEFHGVGGMGSNHFLHLGSLFGLLPLACFNYAEVKKPKLGPAELIKSAFPEKTKLVDISTCFLEVHEELKKIWGPQITLALMENTFCEVARCAKATISRAHKKHKKLNIDCITDPKTTLHESPKTDLIFYDENKRCVQNFFRVVSTAKNSSPLRPVLMMKNSAKWNEESSQWQHNLGNWTQNQHDKKMVYWSEYGDQMTLKSTLETTHDFDKLFL